MPRPPADAPLLNLGLIRRTALRLIDQDGLEALSMRKLASELKVTPRSLYHYVPTKDALLREVYVSVLEELELPDPHAMIWQDGLRLLAHRFRDLALEHRSVASYFLGDNPPTLQELAVLEYIVKLLRVAGLEEADLLGTAHVLIVLIVSYIASEVNAKSDPIFLAERRALAATQLESFPALLTAFAASDDATKTDFDVALELLIGGVEGRVG